MCNAKSTVHHKKEVSKHLEEELKLGRISGPFKSLPFPSFQLNPIGLVPKKSGSYRMIVNLSSPKGDSINDFIPDTFATVSYTTLAFALKLIIVTGVNVYLAKSDIKSAFRLLPLRKEDYNLLCFRWEDQFFYDRCLPMGARSSCFLFESFSTALEFLVKARGHKGVCHYLDDFLFIHSSHEGCSKMLEDFKQICSDIKVPLAEDKTVEPTQDIEFLGFKINTSKQVKHLL